MYNVIIIASFPGLSGDRELGGLGTTAYACAKATVYFPYNTP